jgi:hypothetical protein
MTDLYPDRSAGKTSIEPLIEAMQPHGLPATADKSKL